MKYSLIAAALVLVAGSSAASAEGFMPWTDVMKMYDANHDGVISMEEAKDHKLGEQFPGFMPFFQDHFADLDTDHDGTVSEQELANMMHKMNWTDKEMVNQFYKNTGFMPTNPSNQ
jgi:hypothetical protein